MTYHSLSTDSGGSAEDRRAEATRIIELFGEERSTRLMQEHERRFVESMAGLKPVSTRQLFWLRDLKDKYLE